MPADPPTPAPIQTTGLDHVQILAPRDTEPAIRAFYGTLLGLPEVEKPPELRPRGGVWFRIAAGPILLHVGVEPDPPAAGRRHFAFRVADLAATRTALNAAGMPTGEAPAVAGMPRFYAYDPWGNQIEFLTYTGDGPNPPAPLPYEGRGEPRDAPDRLAPPPYEGRARLDNRPEPLASSGAGQDDEWEVAWQVEQRAAAELRQRAKEFRRDMTAAEAVIWDHLRANRLAGLHFRRQHVIGGFIVDFYCHAARLVLEIDGGIHAAQAESDAARDQILTANALRVLRVTNEEVRNDLPGVLRRVAAIAQARVQPTSRGRESRRWG